VPTAGTSIANITTTTLPLLAYINVVGECNGSGVKLLEAAEGEDQGTISA
jgi:hypothetical protein